MLQERSTHSVDTLRVLLLQVHENVGEHKEIIQAQSKREEWNQV